MNLFSFDFKQHQNQIVVISIFNYQIKIKIFLQKQHGYLNKFCLYQVKRALQYIFKVQILTIDQNQFRYQYQIIIVQNVRMEQFNLIYNNIYQYRFKNYIVSRIIQEIMDVYTLDHKINKNHKQGAIGSAIMAENVRIAIVNLKLLNNIATYQGGALYFSINNNQFNISQTILYNNKAKQGGGIYLQGNSKLNQENFIKSWMKLNSASLLPNNLQEMPTHLSLSINNIEMKTIQKKINNKTSDILFLQPYLVMEQGKVQLTKLLMLPSNQVIINYKIYNPSQLKFENYLEEFSISYKNNLNEKLPNFSNSTCEIFMQTLINDTLIDSTNIANIEYHSESNNFDLRFLSITINPQKQNNQTNQIQIVCHLNDQSDTLLYYIEIKGFMCQLGEFYFQSGCQICQSSQGYYSVTYNTTKCSIFDQNKFESITSNQIQLKKGYWRPDYQSDLIEHLLIFVKEDGLCHMIYVQQDILEVCVKNVTCIILEDKEIIQKMKKIHLVKIVKMQLIVYFRLFLPQYALISTLLTLRSIDKSNKLFSSLKIRQGFVKIIFKLNQVIFTFNFQFQFSFTFINQTSNTSYFMANNMDCYLSQIYNISLVYNRIITMTVIMVCQLLIIYMGFKLYSIIKHQKFNSCIISTTLLYLYVSNYASLIKQLFSLLAKRIISDIEYIQGDVSLLYNSQNHQKWIIGFVLLGLGLIGFLIPSALFLLLYIQRDKLDKIKFRKHICYLFNEYNNENYFWEWIKLWKKTVIILIMTYFETNIFLKASLLGLCLLLYQLYAVRQKPYILNNLNELDVSTGQICSIAIFFATIKYINEQQGNKSTSVLIEMILVLLCLKLSYPFIIDLLRVYYKKYKILLLSNLYDALKIINCNLSLTIYCKQKIKLNEVKQFIIIYSYKENKNLKKIQENQEFIYQKYQNFNQNNKIIWIYQICNQHLDQHWLVLNTYRNQYL
ncbi:unnamed protein product [Paramecium pentaurelia]|uniref:Transmembrane protein n=1 Tax=Paramecium pentaurelia TaxID=43138 RepID=A0A8S1WL51_9CILI|nr:unnamed protein product [Paramecium pentaurelia]